MIRRSLLLVVLPVAVGAVVAAPVAWWLGPRQWAFAAAGFGLCVPPGVATLVLADVLARKTPFGHLLALVIGTALRLVVAVGGAVVVVFAVGPEDPAGKVGFLVWVLFAYLTTLAAETALLLQPVPAVGAKT